MSCQSTQTYCDILSPDECLVSGSVGSFGYGVPLQWAPASINGEPLTASTLMSQSQRETTAIAHVLPQGMNALEMVERELSNLLATRGDSSSFAALPAAASTLETTYPMSPAVLGYESH